MLKRMDDMNNIECENKALYYFLIKQRKKFNHIIDANEKSIEKTKNKMIVNDKNAIKFNAKISESRRNVYYHKKEMQQINLAINELEEGRKKSVILEKMRAKLEMLYIKKEIDFIFIASIIIYFFLHILQMNLKIIIDDRFLFDLLTVLPVLSLALITLWVPNLYETKCQQYNKYQVLDSRKISDQDIKIERSFILKGFAKIFFVILSLEIIIPLLKLLIL